MKILPLSSVITLLTLIANPVVTIAQPTSPLIKGIGGEIAQNGEQQLLQRAEQLNKQVIELYKQAKFAEAIPLAKEVLGIREKVLGPDHPLTAQSLSNLAGLYKSQGNYSAAEPLFKRTLAIIEKVLGPEHPLTARTLGDLAKLYSEQGNYSAAEPLYKRALTIREKVLGPEHPDTATSLNNLAQLYKSQGNYTAAEPLYKRALAISEKVLGTEALFTATPLNGLALLYYSQGNYSAAEPLYKRALAIREKVLGSVHPNTAQSLNNLALLYRIQGNYKAAESLYKRALAISEKILDPEHPIIAFPLINLAGLYQSQGNLPLAIEYLKRGLDIEEVKIDKNLIALGTESRRQDYMATFSDTTNFTISLHLQEASNNTAARNLALTTIFRRKGRILDAETETLRLLNDNLTPENRQLLEELSKNQSELAALIYKGIDQTQPEIYKIRVDTLRKRIDQLQETLAKRSQEYRTEKEPITIETVQKLIPNDTVLLEYILYKPIGKNRKDHYAAYLLFPNGDIKFTDLGDAETIDKAIFNLRNRLQNPDYDVKEAARTLDQLVMQPVRALIPPLSKGGLGGDQSGEVRKILVSPDGQLNLVPLMTLMDENNEYLVKNYLFTYLTTGRDLVRFTRKYDPKEPPIMLANPNYNNANPVLVASNRGDNKRSTDLAKLAFDPLPGTKQEAEAIAKILPNLTLYSETEATENKVKKVKAPQILHLATHGFFLENVEKVVSDSLFNRGISVEPTETIAQQKPILNAENPLLRSGLALSGFNKRNSGTEDGVLTAFEVAGLNLRGNKLVVLSACETGVGDVKNGEGVYGLRRAFVLAGSESQLMSLWQVSDDGTKDLMVNYYTRILKNEPRSEALRQVQLDMLNSSEYTHPYFWGAFIFNGQWTPFN